MGISNELVKLISEQLTVQNYVLLNFALALKKGGFGLINEAFEIPKAAMKKYVDFIRLQTEVKREEVKAAISHQLKKLESDNDFASKALASYKIKIFEEQLNKDTIAGLTFEKLLVLNHSPKEDNKTSNCISEDWLTAFWNLAGTKSETDIQDILSKILANELVEPGAVSLHTLQLLSVLNSDIGSSFKKLCNLSIEYNEMAFVIHPNVNAFFTVGPLNDYNISPNDLFKLSGAGLIDSVNCVSLKFGNGNKEGENQYETIDLASRKAKIAFKETDVLNLIMFTNAGKELKGLMDLIPNEKYQMKIKELFKGRIIFD